MVTVAELLNDQAVRAYIVRLIGEQGIELLLRFPEGDEFSDEELAEKTGVNLNTVRHTLYTLYEKRLAEYRRLKNNETGWLTYLWQLKMDRVHQVIEEDVRDALEHLEARLRFEEENDFYMCKVCGATYTFSIASNTNFQCPNCEEVLDHFENELLVNALRKRVRRIRECLGSA